MPRNISVNKRLKMIEEDIAQVGDLLGFCIGAVERMSPLLADLVLKSQGTTLEDFIASQETTTSGIEEEEDEL